MQDHSNVPIAVEHGLKEANETEYWLELLHETKYIEPAEFSSIHQDVVELLKLLTSIINSTKQRMAQ